jgi:ubiquinone/menaquinone biosynthesis C-methylase UbiE
MRRAAGAVEHLDGPVDPVDREASLADVERLNAWFGGDWLTLRAIARVLDRRRRAGPLVIVDVGGGRGHFARRLRRWARRRGVDARVIVVDREALVAVDGALGVQADATALPLREAGADVVTTSLTLHHLEPDAAVRCLSEMRAAAREAVVVNDLWRTRLTLVLVWLATRLFTRHPYSWDDGPMSVRRSYSPGELRGLAEKAGIVNLVVRRYPWLGRILAVSA